MDKIFNIIKENIHEIFEINGREIAEIELKSLVVHDLGLGSLDIAQLVAMLELVFEKDPFSDGTANLGDILTVEDFCKIYLD